MICRNFTKLYVHLNCGSGSLRSDDNAICYVLLPLWMTSCFYIMGRVQMAHFRSKFNVIRQRAPAVYMFIVKRLQTALASAAAVVSSRTTVCPAAKSAILDYLVPRSDRCEIVVWPDVLPTTVREINHGTWPFFQLASSN